VTKVAPRTLLLVVVAAYFVVQAVLVGFHFAYTHDETVYLSQLDPKVPDLEWDAWRSWGTAVLLAPMSLFSAGLAATRAWVALLTTAGLLGAFWPWVKVLRGHTAPLAAALFASAWVTVYFGNAVQPNLFIALGAVATVGLFLRATYGDSVDTRVRLLVLIGVVIAAIGVVRPPDAVAVGGPLAVACLFVPATRRPALLTPLALGVVVGWLPWVIEAYLRFGGPVHRYHLSNAHDAVGGLHPNLHTLSLYLRSLDGNFYGGRQYGAVGGFTVWWLVVAGIFAVAVALGLLTAIAASRATPLILCTVIAGLFALLYVFLLNYSALRFLLPIFALLSLPAAAGAMWVVRRQTRMAAIVAASVVVAVLGGQAVGQLVMAEAQSSDDRPSREVFETVGLTVRHLHLGPGCFIIGSVDPSPTAYWARCRAGAQASEVGGLGGQVVGQAAGASARGRRVVLLANAVDIPTYFAAWAHMTVHTPDGKTVHVWISPT
jgi:hypothetical protein